MKLRNEGDVSVQEFRAKWCLERGIPLTHMPVECWLELAEAFASHVADTKATLANKTIEYVKAELLLMDVWIKCAINNPKGDAVSNMAERILRQIEETSELGGR